MSILIERGAIGPAEADHRIANNLASPSGVIRLQRRSISKSGKSCTADQVCILLDDISARIEATAKLHKSLAQAANGSGVNRANFVQEIAEMSGSLGPAGGMDLSVDGSCNDDIDARHALHAGLIAAELLTNASKYAHPTGLPVKVHIRCESSINGSFLVEVRDDGVGFPEEFNPAIDGGMASASCAR